jgi:pimeloyl-ACP methyl ester carboxylesterase
MSLTLTMWPGPEREAGPADAPTLVLLHGFPSASHQFRELIPLLADRFHVVAPDLPGFGRSGLPPPGEFSYTFDQLADVIDRWTEVHGPGNFALRSASSSPPSGKGARRTGLSRPT